MIYANFALNFIQNNSFLHFLHYKLFISMFLLFLFSFNQIQHVLIDIDKLIINVLA